MRHKGGSRDLDGRRDVSEPAPDEDDVGGLDGDLCARASRARWNRDAANVAREMLGRRGPSRPSWCTCRRGSKSRETPTSRRGSVCERCRCYGHRSGWDVGDRGVLVRRTWACCEGARVAKKKSRGRTPRDALELAGLHESERFVSVRAEEEESAEDLGARAYSYSDVTRLRADAARHGDVWYEHVLLARGVEFLKERLRRLLRVVAPAVGSSRRLEARRPCARPGGGPCDGGQRTRLGYKCVDVDGREKAEGHKKGLHVLSKHSA